VVGVKKGYKMALYVLVIANMSTLNTDMVVLRERRPEVSKKQDGMNEPRRTTHRPRHVFTYPTTVPPDERQPLLRTLTRLDDDSERFLQAENDVERDLDQLIALKNREELEEVFGIPVIVMFIDFFPFLLSTRICLIFVLHIYSASSEARLCLHWHSRRIPGTGSL